MDRNCCVCHITKLYVHDALKVVNNYVVKLRTIIFFTRTSTRKKIFIGLCLDIFTSDVRTIGTQQIIC